MSTPTAKPLVKYVGGKRSLISSIAPFIPDNFLVYHEPFVGGAAMYLEMATRRTDPKRKWAILSDVNGGLIELYREVRDAPRPLLHKLGLLERLYHTQDPEDLYYRVRDGWNQGFRSPDRYVFLKQTAFNGLWRENKAGGHNAPWGKYQHPAICDIPNTLEVSALLQGATVTARPWEASLALVRPDDFVYLDPPYLGTFSNYASGGFDAAQHVALLQQCRRLQHAGAHVLYSNQDSTELRELIAEHWPEAHVEVLLAKRSCSADGTKRQPAKEVLLHSG